MEHLLVQGLFGGGEAKIPTDLNIISPDYKAAFKTKAFEKVDYSNLVKFSAPAEMSFASKAFAAFSSQYNIE
jgi:hypothetical protein